MILNLSYKLSVSTPTILGSPTLEQLSDMERGSPCNSFRIHTGNHAGTHVDGPFHFNQMGRKISDYEIAELIFDKPAIIEISVQKSELIYPSHLTAVREVRGDCNLLFVRSGFGHYRKASPRIYIGENPGFSRSAARFLLDSLPKLKALAVDFISITSSKHLDEGFEAHREFLGSVDRTVLLIEDARIASDLSAPDRVIVVPWFFEDIDSAPCTVLAEYTRDTMADQRDRTLNEIPR